MIKSKMYYNSWINSVQIVKSSKKMLQKAPLQSIFYITLENPHMIVTSLPWNGFSKNSININPVLYLQSLKSTKINFISSKSLWTQKFKNTNNLK